ncbi:hypothetical protein [Streptomyces sp. NPDC059063]|uniref:hypothetical protein n=1 Tax=unclassified Streptomyces TaxID=2593676 RepID=UPI0036BF3999
MAAVAMKAVELICAWCKEEWTYHRPQGKPGRNPATNPEHPQCGLKRQNQNRAIRRQRGVYESWNIPPADKAENLTVEEEAVRRDAMERPWWRSRSTVDLAAASERYLWDEWRSDDRAHIGSTVKYSTPEDRRTVELWFQDSRAAKTGDYLGQTASPGRKLPVIGSALPWHEAGRREASSDLSWG